LTLGQAEGDGTADLEVTVATTFSKNTEGTGTLTATVVETATGFEFLRYTATIQKPTLTYGVPTYGLDALAADGTGQAYILIKLVSQGSVTRTFTNANPDNGNTLINFGEETAPSGTASGSGSGTIEFMGEIVVAKTDGKLVARIGHGGSGTFSRIQFRREGGPALDDPDLTFSKLQVGVLAVGSGYMVSVGGDFPAETHVAADATVDLTYAVTGVGEGLFVGAQVAGPFEMPMTFFEGPTGSFTGAMKGLGDVDDGRVQLTDATSVEISAFLQEPGPMLEHSITSEDLPQDIVSSAYLGSFAFITRTVGVFH
jgi:hypothetical protein